MIMPNVEKPLTEEPKARGSLVRDRDGDLWKRGNTRWTCQASVDGERVLRVGRLPWFALVSQYGPLTRVFPPTQATP